MGQCVKCNTLKTDILSTILDLGTRLVTEIVIDSRTARDLLK